MHKKNEIIRHYDQYKYEADRLSSGTGLLEYHRTIEILLQYLPDPPAVILDIGGGPGRYTCWLLEKGYEAHLVDPVPIHIEQAAKVVSGLKGEFKYSLRVGDAVDLEFPNSFADVILYMGPLYHLVNKDDRLRALGEAYRVLRTNGILFGVGISKFASFLDGLFSNFIKDPVFVNTIEGDLRGEGHKNPTDNPLYFTDAYFHHPDELEDEIKEAGFVVDKVLAIDGPASWLREGFTDIWNDIKTRNHLLRFTKLIEDEKSLLGMSAHIITIAQKPG